MPETMDYIQLLNLQCRDNTAPVMVGILPYLKLHMDRVIFDETGNLIADRGEGRKPCLVAHADTVQDVNYKKRFIESGGKVWGGIGKNRAGIGADDKNGIWIILDVIKKTSCPLRVIITYGEETGCIGAGNLKSEVFEDVIYCLQFDRNGKGDIIQYGSDKFMGVICDLSAPYGYREAQGIFSDVTTINSNHLVSCVNLSCGYYNAHTNSELTIIKEMHNARDLCLHLLANVPDDDYTDCGFCFEDEEDCDVSRRELDRIAIQWGYTCFDSCDQHTRAWILDEARFWNNNPKYKPF